MRSYRGVVMNLDLTAGQSMTAHVLHDGTAARSCLLSGDLVDLNRFVDHAGVRWVR
eukprot:m.93866 g.93866  ORF g.93866 m.93866 type:complete len:56 (-) comp12187_c0_seq4:221-388(-)